VPARREPDGRDDADGRPITGRPAGHTAAGGPAGHTAAGGPAGHTAAGGPAGHAAGRSAGEPRLPRSATVDVVRAVLDRMHGSAALISPVRTTSGEIADWRIEAITPQTGDVSGRGPAEMVGRLLLDLYPGLRGGAHLAAYARVLATGEPAELGPFPYTQRGPHVPHDARYTLRVSPFGEALLVAWLRVDPDWRLQARRASIERLGNLGWVAWNQIDRTVECSAQMYEILGRDPESGPPTIQQYGELIHPDDYPVVLDAFTALVDRDQPYDVQYRLRIGGRTAYVRSVAELTRDSAGQPIEMFAIVQDVTAMQQARHRLAVVDERLQEQERRLAEEHRLAAHLQQIILPVPAEPVQLAGLRVAVRYLPAEQAARIGGDWFYADLLPDGSVLMAVGDVAGHGLPAASTMARLRNAMAGIAAVTPRPARILSTLNGMLCRQPGLPVLASAAVARIHSSTGTLTWAQAGHPPALLISRGRVRRLRRPAGILLGARPDSAYGQAGAVLAPGDAVVLYTDGLIESATVNVEEGVRALVGRLRTAVPDGGDLLPTISRLRPLNPGDDACVVAGQLAI
jgi:serine phosphatase RsbU (regulator of sigma subunit)